MGSPRNDKQRLTKHELIDALDEARRIFQLPALSQQRLLEQNQTEAVKGLRVHIRFEFFDQRMGRIDLKNRLHRVDLLPGRFQHTLEVAR